MAISAKVGSFNIDTGVTVGNPQSVTGLGFQPKAIIFWWNGSTATGDSVSGGNAHSSWGIATSSSARYCAENIMLDAQTTPFSVHRITRNDCCIFLESGKDTVDGYADFTSFDAGGFTLTIWNQFSIAIRVSYLALGGDDLTNVKAGDFQLSGSTGEFSIGTVGFQPDAILLGGNGASAFNEGGTWARNYIGMATDSSEQGVVTGGTQDGEATVYAYAYGYNGEVNAIESYATAIAGRCSFVSFDADGFNLNHLTDTAQDYVFYLALKGGQFKVGELTTRTDGNDIVETVGFQPKAILFASANRAHSTLDTSSAHNRMTIGAATSTSNRATQAMSDENGLSTSETAYANYDSAVYAQVVDDATVGLMDLKSVESDGFTCVMDDTDPSGCWVTYLAIGDEEEVTTITTTVVVTDDCV